MPVPPSLIRASAVAGLLALSAALLSGCVGASPRPTEQAPALDFESELKPQWTTSAQLVGALATAPGVVVSYVEAEGSGLEIVAWDAHTGLELWRDDAVPGNVNPVEQLDAHIVTTSAGVFVPYLRLSADQPQGETGWQQIVVADATTGVPVAMDPVVVSAFEPPIACPDGYGICFVGVTLAARNTDQRSFRLDPAEGTLQADTDLALPVNARFLGDRIFATNDRAPDGVETLGYTGSGATEWTVPYGSVFGENATSDNGWTWNDTTTGGLLIGTGATYLPDHPDSLDYSISLTKDRTVALNRETGAVVWALDGVTNCIAANIERAILTDVVPLCRVNAGALAVTEKADGGRSDMNYVNLDIDLVGVNTTSGAVEWTVPLGGDQSVYSSGDSVFYSRSAPRPVSIIGEVTVIDAVTGAQSAAPRTGTYACSQNRADITVHGAGDDTGVMSHYAAGQSVYPCDVNRGDLHSAVFSPGSMLMAGIDVGGGDYVVGTRTSLNGYHLGDSPLSAP